MAFIQSYILTFIHTYIHIMSSASVLCLLATPGLFPWRVRERVWRETGAFRLLHLLEGDGKEEECILSSWGVEDSRPVQRSLLLCVGSYRLEQDLQGGAALRGMFSLCISILQGGVLYGEGEGCYLLSVAGGGLLMEAVTGRCDQVLLLLLRSVSMMGEGWFSYPFDRWKEIPAVQVPPVAMMRKMLLSKDRSLLDVMETHRHHLLLLLPIEITSR